MSRENVDLVRRMAEVWNEAGWEGVADQGLLHPDVEYHDDRRWWGFLCRVKERQITYIQAYLKPEQALEAAGLSE